MTSSMRSRQAWCVPIKLKGDNREENKIRSAQLHNDDGHVHRLQSDTDSGGGERSRTRNGGDEKSFWESAGWVNLLVANYPRPTSLILRQYRNRGLPR